VGQVDNRLTTCGRLSIGLSRDFTAVPIAAMRPGIVFPNV
jgi:hypothetical protein